MRMESRMQRVRTERRELHSAVRGIREVRWSVPDGFTVAPEPSTLDDSLVNSAVYMRWETYGWQMGKITRIVTSATPQLVKKFNYRIVRADGSKGPAKLQVDNYGHGSHARYNSWVILTPATGGLSRRERCGAWPCVRCLPPLAGGGSAEKRLRGCNYSVIVITV